MSTNTPFQRMPTLSTTTAIYNIHILPENLPEDLSDDVTIRTSPPKKDPKAPSRYMQLKDFKTILPKYRRQFKYENPELFNGHDAKSTHKQIDKLLLKHQHKSKTIKKPRSTR